MYVNQATPDRYSKFENFIKRKKSIFEASKSSASRIVRSTSRLQISTEKQSLNTNISDLPSIYNSYKTIFY